jgi:sugar phosphate isomerase/epimerase
VDSGHLGILFDIGNTISHGHEPWEFYTALQGAIDYVHVKDAHRDLVGKERSKFCYPGEGDALVRPILTDMLNRGYRGVIAIEPHVASIVHLKGQKPDPEQMRESYLKYGRDFMNVVKEIQANSPS